MVYGLSVMFIAGSVASCKKSSKGKISNEWTVSAWEQTTTEKTTTGGSTDTEVSTVKIDGTTVTVTSSTNGVADDPQTGTVNALTYTISKDGTWSSVMDVTFKTTFDVGGTTFTYTTNQKMENSGTWDFLNGVSKDFKKNERVVFNTLSAKTTTNNSSNIPGDSPSTDVDSETFAEGENSMIYVIVESKKKELQLSSEENNSYTTDGYTSTNVGSTTMTLIQP